MKKGFSKDFAVQILSIAVIIVLCCINIKKLNYIAVLNDEFGYWGNAISLLNYDWSSLIAETPYYSWGYSIWLVPIIAILPTPELWYKAAISLNIIFLIISYLLICNFGTKLFSNVDRKIVYLVSLCTVVYPSNILYAQVAWSETLLYLLMWCATLLLVSLEEKFTYKKFVVKLYMSF